MAEFEPGSKGLIVTGHLKDEKSPLTRGLQLAPEGYKSTPIVDLEGLNERVAKGPELKFVVVGVDTPDWPNLVHKLNDSGVEVYVYDILGRASIANEAFKNGARGVDNLIYHVLHQVSQRSGK